MRRAWYEALQRWAFKRSTAEVRAYILSEQHKVMGMHEIVHGGMPLTAVMQHNVLHAIDNVLTEWEEMHAETQRERGE